MKKPLSWHRECLLSMRGYAERQRLAIERARAAYNRTLDDIAYYNNQILFAESMGKDGFDRDKFGKKVAQ